MKNTISIVILSVLMLACSKDDSSLTREIKVDSTYLLLPIQESADHTSFRIIDPAGVKSIPLNIRIAKDSVDYWVKYQVKEYLGKRIQLICSNKELPMFGINKIYQSNSFKINFEEPYRPKYHFSPEYGWMNDPNGMVYYDGEYHLFYQYNPYGNKWENMHWGHAVSNDLLSWTYLGAPIAPDENGAIFSGSAIIDKNNTAGFGNDAMIAIYTSSGLEQNQSIAYSLDRGRTFTKYQANPVLSNPGTPHFRDPKVSWNDELSKWIMVLATGHTASIYASSNLKEWEKLSEFGDGIGSHAGIWECPDLFSLKYKGETKWVLLVSLNPGGPNNGSATQYFIGDFANGKFVPDALPYPLWIDYGQDNYAGVTWENIPEQDNRRLFIGWMSNWNYANSVPSQYFRSAMTIPRELRIKTNGNHLILASDPINELKTIEKIIDTQSFFNVNKSLSLNQILNNLDGSFSISMKLIPQNSLNFGFKLFNETGDSVDFAFSTLTDRVSINRQYSALDEFNLGFTRVAGAPLFNKKEFEIKILVDRASVEMFLNDGDLVMTSTIFPKNPLESLLFYTKDGSLNVSEMVLNKIN